MHILVTTSRDPSDFGRRLARIISHIVPNSKRVNRGRMNLYDIKEYAIGNNFDRVYLVRTKFGHSAIIDIYRVTPGGLEMEGVKLHLTNVIDHKIYGWQRIPGGAPMSSSEKILEIDEVSSNFLRNYFGLTFDKITSIGLLMDRDEEGTLINLVDTKTNKTFFSARMRVL